MALSDDLFDQAFQVFNPAGVQMHSRKSLDYFPDLVFALLTFLPPHAVVVIDTMANFLGVGRMPFEGIHLVHFLYLAPELMFIQKRIPKRFPLHAFPLCIKNNDVSIVGKIRGKCKKIFL